MASSLSTLSPLERSIAGAPLDCFEHSVCVHNFGDNIDCIGRNYGCEKRLNAIRVHGDCFDVTVVHHPKKNGRLERGDTIRFTTSKQWVMEWAALVSASRA